MHITNKTVMVTGATGLLGSKLVCELLNNNNTVIVLARNEKKIKACFKDFLNSKKFIYYVQDVVSDFDNIKEDIDYIFHAAGPISSEIIRNSPVDVITPNIIGTLNVLNFLKQQNEKKNMFGKAIIFSSATVYTTAGEEKVFCEEDTQLTQGIDDITACYFESKRMSEVIAKSYCKQYNMPVTIARLGYIYGPTLYEPNTAFYQFCKAVSNGENIVINATAIARRDNIYIDDAVEALQYLAIVGANGESYNISSGGELSNFVAADEMADILVQIANKENSTKIKVEKNSNILRDNNIMLNNEKLKKLGWQVKTSIYEGVKLTLENYIKNKEQESVD